TAEVEFAVPGCHSPPCAAFPRQSRSCHHRRGNIRRRCEPVRERTSQCAAAAEPCQVPAGRRPPQIGRGTARTSASGMWTMAEDEFAWADLIYCNLGEGADRYDWRPAKLSTSSLTERRRDVADRPEQNQGIIPGRLEASPPPE